MTRPSHGRIRKARTNLYNKRMTQSATYSRESYLVIMATARATGLHTQQTYPDSRKHSRNLPIFVRSRTRWSICQISLMKMKTKTRPRQDWCKALNKKKITYHRTLSLRFSDRSTSSSKRLIQLMTLSAYSKKLETPHEDQPEIKVRMEMVRMRVTSQDL